MLQTTIFQDRQFGLAVVLVDVGQEGPQVLQTADLLAIDLDDDVVRREPISCGRRVGHDFLDVKPVVQPDRQDEPPDAVALDGGGAISRRLGGRRAQSGDGQPSEEQQRGNGDGA